VRVLFVAAPMQGHLLPLLPLALACRDAGHDVILASGALPIGPTGLELHDIGGRFNLPRSAIPVALRHPGLLRAELAGRAGSAFVGELFGRLSRRWAKPLLRLAQRNRPDLIVYESLGEAGALVAGELGVPSVQQESTLWPAGDLFRAVSQSSALRRDRVPAPELTITIGPSSVVGPRSGRPMRPVPYSGGGDVPQWLLEPSGKPRIVVSRSTLNGPPGDDPSAATVAAAAGVDADFVLVRPPESVTKAALPPNVRTVERVPLHRVLPHVTAFVHHGGAGSVLNGLAVGIPQLVVPGPGDRRFNAELLTRRGAGLAVAAADITPAHLNRLLTDAGLRSAAQEVSVELAAMPEPATLVPVLEALAGKAQ
jgi:UDP:flavonoid glycosyltransferase YjiC (YdhE family)